MAYEPFTYLLVWSKAKLWYYGARYKEGTTPADLWTIYFTSSEFVEETRRVHGEPDIIEVRRVFKDAKETLRWEQRVLRRMKIRQDSTSLNRCVVWPLVGKRDKSTAEKISKSLKGKSKSEEHRKRISEALKGKPARGGKPMSKEHREKIAQANIGKGNFRGRKHTPETRQKMKEAALRRGKRGFYRLSYEDIKRKLDPSLDWIFGDP